MCLPGKPSRIMLFRINQISENIVTKNITQTETPLDPDPFQKTTDIASNSSKPKQVQNLEQNQNLFRMLQF